MKQFIEGVQINTNYGETQNGAVTHLSTLDSCLDLFATGGALRGANKQEIINLFTKAFCENPLIALKTLFYLRDIREGMGERRIFRIIIKDLATRRKEAMVNNFKFIPFFGRWDDLYELFDTPLEGDVIAFMKEQIEEDLKVENPSLCAKWLKSINTSSKESVRLAQKTAKGFGWTHQHYRKTLAKLRKKIEIIETKIAEKRYDEIDYSKVPSQAMLKYKNTFYKNDEDRYSQYIQDVMEGKQVIKTGTLYPHQIVRDALKHDNCDNEDMVNALDAMWNNLPNKVTSDENVLVVADVSGSMQGTPMEVSIALAIYFAERTKGEFKDYFMTFSERPKLIKVVGKGICEKVSLVYSSDWGFNTDIEKVFATILKVAKEKKLTQQELPSKIVIVSDMEFDTATEVDVDDPLFEGIKKSFEEEGYTMPTLVFWNVNASTSNFPVVKDTSNAILVSGFSINLFNSILNGTQYNPLDFMLEVINNERYSVITI